jgi:REP element-mobilizing transposase RayT
MPRKLRVEYPGAMYQVMSRGDRREDIFLDDVDRHDFIKTLAEACQKTGWQVHAWCLMRNHYHLVLETPNANLVGGMAWLQSTYTIRLNHRHKLFGHVFSGRYKAQLVEGSGNGYLRTACDYVHLNPVRARSAQGRRPAAGLSVEQPGLVSGRAGTSARLAAGGPAVGRTRIGGRHGRRATGIRAADGSAAAGGDGRGVAQAFPARLVFGRRGL